jgi:hypothetical protein
LRGASTAAPRAHFTDSERWRARALDPNDLAQIVREAIKARFAWGTYRTIFVREAAMRRELLTHLA